MPGKNGKKPGNGENIAAAVTEVSERVSLLVREEFELAKAEVTQKVTSIAKGTAAVAAGGVFGFFAIIFALLTLAWGLDAIIVSGAGDIWIGFLIVFGILSVLALASFLFAWRKLKVGAPKPDMAIDEAKKIRQTVADKAAEKPAQTANGAKKPAQIAPAPLKPTEPEVKPTEGEAKLAEGEEKLAEAEEKPEKPAETEEKPVQAVQAGESG